MGTHPIFESDFDCLTECPVVIISLLLEVVIGHYWNLNLIIRKKKIKVTPGGAKFLMVHDLVNDDGIRNFFVDVYEMWIRLRLNPFYQPDTEITNRQFIGRVKHYGQRYFGTS